MALGIQIRRYVTESGKDVFGEWLSGLKDARTQARVVARIDRLAVGNLGDCKPLGGGLFELRIDWGPGYRIYYAMIGRSCVLLLSGGDKKRQTSDIRRAREYLKDYWGRSRETKKN
jgi:putative addiction module killer protein